MLTANKPLRSLVTADGAVILDIPRNRMHTLNATGAYIWQRIVQGKPIPEVIRELACETGADPLLVEHDVNEFLAQLITNHLIEN